MTLPNVDTVETYGGLLVDYGIGVVNSETDRAAENANRAYANVAMATHTNVRAWARFTAAATTGAMVLQAHDALWGNTSFVVPTLSRSTQGVFDITWPTSVTPETAETAIPINIRCVGAPNVEGTSLRIPQASRQAANIVRVYTFDAAGALQDFAGTTYTVWWI